MRDFIYITDRSYSREQILKMEAIILSALNFDILTVSPYTFLQRFHFLSCDNLKSFYLAQFLIELSLLEYRMIFYSPSLKASAALYLSRKILKVDNNNYWTNTLQFHTGFSERDLDKCAKDLFNILELVPNITLTSCKNKFALHKYMEVSKIADRRV